MCTRKNYSATWCAPSIKLHIMKLREKDEFKEKSKQCSLNKKNPEKEMPLHCKGSKSSVKLRIDLEQKLKRKVTVAEVYREAHVNKKQKFVDKTSENVWSVGGWKNGRIYGLGSAANDFYEKPCKDSSVKKARINHVNHLESQVEQVNSENAQLKQQLDETKGVLTATTEKLDQTNQIVKTLQQQMQILLSGHFDVIGTASSTNLPPTPHVP
uniref:Uncharacterized protein n=1 Tax=Chenopodium quinoa TaxID=63459 RepID=A0A803N0K3_CHEQI